MRRKRLFRRKSRDGEKFYDPNTGEEVETLVICVPRRKTNGFGERWMAVAQDPGKVLAHSNLVGADFKIMFLLLNKLDFENHLLINQAELASEIGMLRQNVRRSIKRLIEVGVIMEGPKSKQSRSYRLNPEFGWKGSGENHKKALRKHREERMKAAKITGVIEGGEETNQPEGK